MRPTIVLVHGAFAESVSDIVRSIEAPIVLVAHSQSRAVVELILEASRLPAAA